MLYLTNYEMVFKPGETIEYVPPTEKYLKGIIEKNIPDWKIEKTNNINKDIKDLIYKSHLADHAMAYDYIINGTNKISFFIKVIFDEKLNILYVDDVNSVKADAFGAGYSKENLIKKGYIFNNEDQTDINSLEIEQALLNAESPFIQEWYKATGFIEVAEYDESKEGWFCLTITDYKFFTHVVDVKNLDELIMYTDPDTYAEFSDFERALANVYCTGYEVEEVTALLQASYNSWNDFNKFATNKRLDADCLKGIKVIADVSDVDDLGDKLLLQHCDTDYMNSDLYFVLDSMHESIGLKFHNLVSGVFTNNGCYVYQYDYTR